MAARALRQPRSIVIGSNATGGLLAIGNPATERRTRGSYNILSATLRCAIQ
jgi:hypothetical protein